MIIVRKLPQDYEAIQFDAAFVAKYGLIKYPMLTKKKHSVYGDTHERWPASISWALPNNNHDVVIGNSVVEQVNRATGRVQMRDDRGAFIVDAPSTTKVCRRWFHTDTLKTIYDCDAPELYEYIYHYYLGSTIVNNKDWIVTDPKGKSKAYAPDEFQERFEVSDKNAEKEK